jgi:hypothetical protein
MGILRPLTVVIALLIACSDGGDRSSNQFADLMMQASDYQRQIMEDGEVAYAEYERAVLDAKRCVEDKVGNLVRVSGPILDRDQVRLVLQFEAEAVGAEVEQIDAEVAPITLACFSEYLDYVEMAYTRTHQPSEAVIRQGIADLIRCLNETGFDGLTVDSTQREVGETVTDASSDMNAAGARCINEHGLGFAYLRQQ